MSGAPLAGSAVHSLYTVALAYEFLIFRHYCIPVREPLRIEAMNLVLVALLALEVSSSPLVIILDVTDAAGRRLLAIGAEVAGRGCGDGAGR